MENYVKLDIGHEWDHSLMWSDSREKQRGDQLWWWYLLVLMCFIFMYITVIFSHRKKMFTGCYWSINKKQTSKHTINWEGKKKSLRYGLALSTVYKYILFGYKMVLSKLTAWHLRVSAPWITSLCPRYPFALRSLLSSSSVSRIF